MCCFTNMDFIHLRCLFTPASLSEHLQPSFFVDNIGCSSCSNATLQIFQLEPHFQTCSSTLTCLPLWKLQCKHTTNEEGDIQYVYIQLKLDYTQTESKTDWNQISQSWTNTPRWWGLVLTYPYMYEPQSVPNWPKHPVHGWLSLWRSLTWNSNSINS